MSVSRDDIKKALGEMPVMELVELIKAGIDPLLADL